MRVVAGTARGRPLAAPAGRSVRPTTDRVREAVLNSLGSLDAVAGAVVLDLFAGSGALGIEALSRGAAHATFVDSDPKALDAVRGNLRRCDLDDRAEVIRSDAFAHLARVRDESSGGAPTLVFCDPPYDFDRWHELLEALAEVAPGAVVVVESDREVDPAAHGEVLRTRRHGGTVVTTIRTAGVPSGRRGLDRPGARPADTKPSEETT